MGFEDLDDNVQGCIKEVVTPHRKARYLEQVSFTHNVNVYTMEVVITMATQSLVAMVQAGIKEAGSALSYIKQEGAKFVSSKISAAVAGAIYIGTPWKKKKGETLARHLKAFDINSERHVKNYYHAGSIIVDSELSAKQIADIGFGKLQAFGKRLIEDEVKGASALKSKVAEYEALAAKKAEEAKAKREAEKADRATATKETAELLNQEFTEEEGLSLERVMAHVLTYLTEEQALQLQALYGDKPSAQWAGITKLIGEAHAAKVAADKAKAEKKAAKKTG